jgi:hypothetical protein
MVRKALVHRPIIARYRGIYFEQEGNPSMGVFMPTTRKGR